MRFHTTSIRQGSLSAVAAASLMLAGAMSLDSLPGTAHAAGGTVTDPRGVAPDRYAYYPGTEALAKDEIRVIACGTGMPSARRGQAATCFLVETGNGDKFIFDIG